MVFLHDESFHSFSFILYLTGWDIAFTNANFSVKLRTVSLFLYILYGLPTFVEVELYVGAVHHSDKVPLFVRLSGL